MVSLPDLPNSLKKLYCCHNKLTSLPDLTNINDNFRLQFYQNEPINYIPYNSKLKLCDYLNNKIIIEGYPNNPIINQDELNKYMNYQLEFLRNRKKSAKK